VLVGVSSVCSCVCEYVIYVCLYCILLGDRAHGLDPSVKLGLSVIITVRAVGAKYISRYK